MYFTGDIAKTLKGSELLADVNASFFEVTEVVRVPETEESDLEVRTHLHMHALVYVVQGTYFVGSRSCVALRVLARRWLGRVLY